MQLNVYSDETLLEYIMVLLANNHTKEKVYEELVLFMEPALTEQFVIWLFGEVEQLIHAQPVQQNFVAAPVAPVQQAAPVVPVQHSVLEAAQVPVATQPLLSNDVQMGSANNSATTRNRSFSKAIESATASNQSSKQQQHQQQPTNHQNNNKQLQTRNFSQAESKPERRSSSRLAAISSARSPKRSDRIVSRGEAPRSVNVDEAGRVQKIRLSVDFERDERRRGRKRIDDKSSEAEQLAKPAPTIKTKCQYWPACKAGAACPNVHPSEPCKHFPNCSKGDACTYLHPVIPCRFQERCTNPNCNYQHRAPIALLNAAATGVTVPVAPMAAVTQMAPMVPSIPAAPMASSALSSIPCRFYPRCINPSCPYLHPVKVACRYGVECTRPDCHFEHPEGRKSAAKSAIYQPCRYGKQCARVDCPYLHDSSDAQMEVTPNNAVDAQMN